MYKITLKKKASKELLKLPSMMIPKVASCIDSLSDNPRPEGSKKLKGSDKDIWRVGVGNYRVVYLIEDEVKIVNIRKVGHRRDVYK